MNIVILYSESDHIVGARGHARIVAPSGDDRDILTTISAPITDRTR